MFLRRSTSTLLASVFYFLLGAVCALAQSGNSGSLEGTVQDPSGAAVANATVELTNPVTALKRSVVTGADGSFRFVNLPFNPYHLVVTA
ncbi:MAG TPA: carboxypeptidase-like regulatory domain-containing protein, partial [Candidatus Acidoferrum sp.]